MQVPLLDLTRQNLPIEAELEAAFRRLLHSGQFILGEEVARFEEAAARTAGAAHAIGVSSGTDAILLALMALGVGPGDEVICPSFTFFATAGCIARVGARPVFADSCPECFNLDPASFESLITERTKAVIPVHLFGQAADLDPIVEIARRRGIHVIEDAAQAFGAEYRGRPVGAFGAFGTVSFFPTKNLGGLGDGGLLVTDDAALAEKARLLRNHGQHPKYYHAMIGGNFRLDAMQAAFLAVKLPRLPEYTRLRQRNAAYYNAELADVRNGTRVRVLTPGTHPDRNHIVNQYTLRVQAGEQWSGGNPRDALRQHLAGQGIASEIYYPVPLHRQECFQPWGPYGELPVAEAFAREVISLPVYPELREDERAAVAKAVREFCS
jgi:dTDP-4-amino-4,6-dideoxygalactose transaminase